MNPGHPHIDEILRVAAHAAPPPETPQQLIRRSWHRCVNLHGLAPDQPNRLRVETASALRESRDRVDEHLQTARAGMQQLYRRLGDLGYALVLTDAEGMVIEYIANPAWSREAAVAGFYLGSTWSERMAGTNGVGTCLAELKPLTCHGDDHFFTGNLILSCSTAPLFLPDGRLMGVLDVSAPAQRGSRDSQQLALQMTQLYGQLIEDANFIREHGATHWLLRLAAGWPQPGLMGDLLLAFDEAGSVLAANTAARRWLLGPERARPGVALPPRLSLAQLFICEMSEIRAMAAAAPRALISATDRQRYHASVVAPPRPVPRAPAAPPAPSAPWLGLAGDDPLMQQLIARAARLVDRRINLLVQGETGSGKEVLARALHAASRRAARPFVAVNCAAIPETLIESELFGYTAGTFTGARARGMKGLILQSDGGTLFLDEVGDMPLPLQTRLLRVLSEQEVLPLGGERPVPVALNVIAASHRELRELVADGRFREDLYYRLCGATLALPPLRERGDLRWLIERLLREEAGAAPAALDAAALALLLRQRWPGNVRQLRGALRYALALADGPAIGVEHLPPELGEARPPPTPAPLSSSDASQLLNTLRAQHWNISAVAADAGQSRSTIYRQMKRFGIVPPKHLG